MRARTHINTRMSAKRVKKREKKIAVATLSFIYIFLVLYSTITEKNYSAPLVMLKTIQMSTEQLPRKVSQSMESMPERNSRYKLLHPKT